MPYAMLPLDDDGRFNESTRSQLPSEDVMEETVIRLRGLEQPVKKTYQQNFLKHRPLT